MLKMSPYLSFKGTCEAAFTFYAQTLGGKVGELFRYGGSLMEGEAPADWADKIMHGSVTVGGVLLMGADVTPERYEESKGFTLSLHMNDTAEAERIFNALAGDGRIVLPLEKTFWAAKFGMVVDRFGTPWTINCDA
jgi:PhnB protein